jgi:AAA domain
MTKKKCSTKISWKPSEEQQVICDHVVNGDNVIVNAVAGSGKSTSILTVANALPKKRFLQITYNAALRKEFKEKVDEVGLTNIEVHTYHSFCVKYFSSEAYTDTGIRHFLYGEDPTKVGRPIDNHMADVGRGEAYPEVPPYDIVVLDESQDMTALYFHLVSYMIHVICGGTKNPGGMGGSGPKRGRPHKIQLLILGDFMQGLYDFKGADIRFLTLAHEIWDEYQHLKSAIFHRCTLKMSYRITNQMAYFINNVMLGVGNEGDSGKESEKSCASTTNSIVPGLQACRDGCPVIYIRQTPNNIESIVVNQIMRLLEGGDSPSDIFILGGSVKGANSMVRRIENALVSRGVPCHVPMIETDSNIDNRVIDGKVVFSTFHSVKGRQRKYVFIVGFDQSYFQFYARDMKSDTCPNTLYVGCTRATHMLYLLETKDWSTDRPLTFLKLTHHEMKVAPYIDFRGVPQSIFYEMDPQEVARREAAPIKHYTSPTDLIRFVPETVLERITPRLKRMFVPVTVAGLIPGDLEGIPSVVCMKSSGLHEDVADLNGIAIPCMYWDLVVHTEGVCSQGSHTDLRSSSRQSVCLHDSVVSASALLHRSEATMRDLVSKTAENGLEKPHQQPVLYRFIKSLLDDSKEGEHTYIKQCFQEIDPTRPLTMADYLYMANMYVAIQERLLFKIRQIEPAEYNWLSDDIIETCRQRLDAVIGHEGLVHHELTIITHQLEDDHAIIDRVLASYTDISIGANGMPIRYRFKARVDMVTEESVWELKCCSQITIDHMLQVIIYAWLWQVLCIRPDDGRPKVDSQTDCRGEGRRPVVRDDGIGENTKKKRTRLFNIKTGEILELVATLEELTDIVVELIRGKYVKLDVLEDQEFVESLREIHTKY